MVILFLWRASDSHNSETQKISGKTINQSYIKCNQPSVLSVTELISIFIMIWYICNTSAYTNWISTNKTLCKGFYCRLRTYISNAYTQQWSHKIAAVYGPSPATPLPAYWDRWYSRWVPTEITVNCSFIHIYWCQYHLSLSNKNVTVFRILKITSCSKKKEFWQLIWTKHYCIQKQICRSYQTVPSEFE